LLCVGVPESVTVKVIEELLTAVVGVPETTPVEVASESPAGKTPLDQVYGAVPPLADNVWLYATPTCPLGSEDVFTLSGVTVGGGGVVESLPPPPPQLQRTSAALAHATEANCLIPIAPGRFLFATAILS
jgi:hypothetical protein